MLPTISFSCSTLATGETDSVSMSGVKAPLNNQLLVEFHQLVVVGFLRRHYHSSLSSASITAQVCLLQSACWCWWLWRYWLQSVLPCRIIRQGYYPLQAIPARQAREEHDRDHNFVHSANLHFYPAPAKLLPKGTQNAKIGA